MKVKYEFTDKEFDAVITALNICKSQAETVNPEKVEFFANALESIYEQCRQHLLYEEEN